MPIPGEKSNTSPSSYPHIRYHRDAAFNLNLRYYLYLLRHMEHCCCNRFRLKRKPSTVFPARNKSEFWKLVAFRVSF